MTEPLTLATDLQDEAIAWHVRLPTLAGAEWTTFTGWLETSPQHRAAYDQVVLADALAGDALASETRPAEGAQVPARAAPRLAVGRFVRLQRQSFGMAVAASVAVVAALAFWPVSGSVQLEQTQAGITKQLDFADGTQIDLNGGTALALDQADPHQVELKHGEARFAVRHGARPFVVAAGGFTLRDLGTVFNVQLTDSVLVLDVTEGKVLFDPERTGLTVSAGQQITVDRRRNVVFKRDSAQAGDWRAGELAFTDASLADVVAAVHRRFGTVILLSAGLQARPFTGNIRLTGDPAKDVPHLARLIGAEYRSEAEGWAIFEGARR